MLNKHLHFYLGFRILSKLFSNTHLNEIESFISPFEYHASFESRVSRKWGKPERHFSIRASNPNIVISSSLHKQRSSPVLLVCLLARRDTVTRASLAWISTQKIGIFGNFFRKNHYQFESFVSVRLCWRIMVTTTFAPPLDKVDPCLSNAVFSIRALLLWPTLELEVIPGNKRIERAYTKYGIRQTRLDLIQKWCKRCSRHYKLTQPHKNKRLKRVIIPCNSEPVENTNF